MKAQYPKFWFFLHLVLIVASLINLLSGLRIASISRPEVLAYSSLLPQGDVHALHFFGAIVLVGLFFLFLSYYAFAYSNKIKLNRPRLKPKQFHQAQRLTGQCILISLVISGTALFLLDTYKALWIEVHYFCALLMLTYAVIHIGGYFIQYGVHIFIVIARSGFFREQGFLLLSGVFLLTLILSSAFLNQEKTQSLSIQEIEDSVEITVDGLANEKIWQQTKEVKVASFGGANFENGQTDIFVKALSNSEDAYFFIRWKDANESLEHLPLEKTEAGWKLHQDGFHVFDEKSHYEDKFAIILANNCKFGAAGTAHLGPRPLKDKPKHWTGKGYHYSDKGIVDLWHWKATRTNQMQLADDGYFGKPDIERPGTRRYTGGYKTDAKESGSYRMNWQWYFKDGIIPKRLPIETETLTPYQGGDHTLAKKINLRTVGSGGGIGGLNENIELSSEIEWLMPWYATEPYSEEKDRYPEGTRMPSTLMYSNTFEGDRGNVQAYGVWRDGYWSLELFRKKNTGSENDIEIKNGICMWVAAFDRSQIAHTRHNRALKLRLTK